MADKNLQTVFESLAKAGGSKDGKLSVDGIKKWFKDAGVIGKDIGITEADVETCVGKICKDKKGLDFSELKQTVTALGKEKKVELKELMEKLAKAGPMKPVKQGAEDMGAKLGKDGK